MQLQSPFPGMDPFIGCQEWEDFHHALIETMRQTLVPNVAPRYAVRVERRIYVESQSEDDQLYIAEVALIDESNATVTKPVATTATITPVECVLPMPEEKRESLLVIRDLETRAIVTVIELLSPGNKRSGSDGRRKYLAKRQEILGSQSHLVELDLLRGGKRLPTRQPLPTADYYAIVSPTPSACRGLCVVAEADAAGDPHTATR
jgi:hypothetical protein